MRTLSGVIKEFEQEVAKLESASQKTHQPNEVMSDAKIAVLLRVIIARLKAVDAL